MSHKIRSVNLDYRHQERERTKEEKFMWVNFILEFLPRHPKIYWSYDLNFPSKYNSLFLISIFILYIFLNFLFKTSIITKKLVQTTYSSCPSRLEIYVAIFVLNFYSVINYFYFIVTISNTDTLWQRQDCGGAKLKWNWIFFYICQNQ